MLLRVENAETKVVQGTQNELDWLKHYLTYQDLTKLFMSQKFGRGNATSCLLDRRGNRFPTGLLPMVIRAAHDDIDDAFDKQLDGVYGERSEKGLDPKREYVITVDDARRPPCEWYWDVDLEWLYEFQYQAVWLVGHHIPRGILKLTTGAGKTEIACGLMMALPCHWLFVVDSADLVWNAARRWEKRTGGMGYGIIGDGHKRIDPDGRATFATFQSLHAMSQKKDPLFRELVSSTQGVIADEVHTAASPTEFKAVQELRNAYFRIGLSGTPLERGDKKSIKTVGAFGPIIYRVMPRELIDMGVLAEPIIRFVQHKEDAGTATWQPAYKKVIVESKSRESLVLDMVQVCRKPAFVFVEKKQHGHDLTKVIQKAGMSAEFVWGDKNTKQRDAALQRLERADLDVLVCSRVFQKGIDLPSLGSVVNAAGMRSTIAALQRLGRAMRSDKGRKTTFEYWDVKDEGDRFMGRHANERLRAFRKEGYDVTVLSDADFKRHQLAG
jgi:superfamily II DNA or RNA helicase